MKTFSYILISNICLTVAYISFKLLFRNNTSFRQQRTFLIASILLSVILPLTNFSIAIPVFASGKVNSGGISYFDIQGSIDTALISTDGFHNSGVFDFVFYIYVIVGMLILIAAAVQILAMIFLAGRCHQESIANLKVLQGERIRSSFSFFRWIFIPKSITDPEEKESIIIHESIHASQYHTVDNFLIELATALMWVNPMIWILRRSLHLIHEYLADEGTINSGIEKLKYQTLLFNQAAGDRLMYIHSGFNNNLLKKRMIMMTKIKKDTQVRFRSLSLISLPVILLLTVAITKGFFPQDAKASSSTLQQKGSKSSDSLNYIVDGRSVKSISDLNPDSIESVNVMKEDRTVIVRTKSFARTHTKITGTTNAYSGNTVFIIDGKASSRAEAEKISPDRIESVNVIKDKEAMKQYSAQDKEGVIIITTKK
jgi:hypothetical protein